jgi:hypothetical protein
VDCRELVVGSWLGEGSESFNFKKIFTSIKLTELENLKSAEKSE